MTYDHVLNLFETLEAAGLQPPYNDADGAERTWRAWAMALGDCSNEQLEEAVRAHLRHPERGRWWPRPAELLHLVPRAQPAEHTTLHGPGSVWAASRDGLLRVLLLDQANRETALAPACGRTPEQRCPANCEPCNLATLRRADELAQQQAEAA